jgi:moderate conductance mechanosensitive channel
VPDWLQTALDSPTLGALLRLALIAVLAALARWGLRIASRQVQDRMTLSVVDAERLDRLKTLVRVGEGAVVALVLLLSGLMALNVLSINIAPLLAGAGVAGLAISLGAQSLFKDFIGGVLILIENQYTVGDVIKVGDTSGSVERITLRATYVRDADGALHLIPNGDVRTMANYTSGWARAVADVNVEYEADMGSVTRALGAAALRVKDDEEFKDALLEEPQTFGWLGFKDWAVQVRLTAKVKPGQQWAVSRAMRRYALEALQAEGVRVAIPAVTVPQ